ncbi:NAD(P)H-dependent oxidoreductase [Dactylosporangium aurantiacum]|uniref:NAD(P)H-dependent oxidoreductase n=1 Tax=Dactylosporangium aurantiacum TaxID=35754 RepID=A0A9Q9IN82_9ACTN|nr:NAD(P)H-dependent oxidoreductase [Dactylosporangium aurantiacum]MDG6109903.1 NAD(P)H-dependent oxidoreductase [Dactylosporangium aurantiacum]UWZ58098.1 NAD(P)H-dependent oxidoreductase [Dactylosporangium aurantiacum]
MIKIAVVLASTRPGRRGEPVADWVVTHAARRTDAHFDLLDLAEVDLPPLDEPLPPATGRYTHEHTRSWAATVAGYDGFVFVTPEYNHSYPGVLKNALDRVCAEWHDKAAAFVSYGFDGGVRAVEALRPVVNALRIAPVPAQVALSLHHDFTGFTELAPAPHQAGALSTALDQLVAWSTALATLRVPA